MFVQPLPEERAISHDIGKGGLVEFRQKSRKARFKQEAQFTGVHQGATVGVGIETFNKVKVAFCMPDHRTDHDLGRVQTKAHAAAPATHILQITKLPQLTGRLQEVRPGNPVSGGDILNPDRAIGIERAVHQNAQRIVCVSC